MKTLYISYFGLNQPLVQTQVLPYLFELSKENDIQLLTFEPETWDETAERQKLKDKGIEWHSLPYRKGNKNTALDILAGADGRGPVEGCPAPLVACVDLGEVVREQKAHETGRVLLLAVHDPQIREDRVAIGVDVLQIRTAAD